MNLLAFLEIPTFTGLPAHPFLNRIAMYMVPTALGIALLALRPRWRTRLAPWAFGLAVAALVSVQLTMGAGEAMDNIVHGDANPLVEDHESWSKLLRIGLILHVLVTGLFFRAVRRGNRRSGDTTGDTSVDTMGDTMGDTLETETPSGDTISGYTTVRGTAVPAASRTGRSVLVTSAMATIVTLAVAGLTVMTAHSGSKSVYLEDGEIMTDEETSTVPTPEDPTDG